jgi:hypothetical protein
MLHRLVFVTIAAAAVAGCQGSGRFSDFGGAGGRPPQAAVAARPPPLAPAPTSPVQSSPLPPVSAQPAPSPGLPPIGSSLPIETPDGGQPRGGARPRAAIDPPVDGADPDPPVQPRPQVAARPEPAPPAAASGPPTRTSVTGNWTAREAAGGNCRVTLSSAPTLDLYKASTSGFQSRELKGVNAWELRGDEVYLYETGGGVAARLKRSGGSFEGSASRTGAPITLSK